MAASTVDASRVRADQSPDVLAVAKAGVTGGLCVILGAEKTDLAVQLGATGRFLVQVLDNDGQVIQRARRLLRSKGLYGLVSVERLPRQGGLPFTENLVNLLIVRPQDAARVSVDEAVRVLCPNGTLIIGDGTTADQLEAAGMVDVRKIGSADGWLMASKAWPAEMDEWSHPRHSSTGNAASGDELVAPPRRVRWVVGATSEVCGMVTTGGRNFYGGVLARDGFNGLRLWDRDLVGRPQFRRIDHAHDSHYFTREDIGSNNPPPVTDGDCLQSACRYPPAVSSDNPPPVAGGDRLYAVQHKKLLALDAATGRTIREYPDAATPKTVLFCEGTLLAVTEDSVRALDAESAKLKWTFSASEPRCVVAGDDTVTLIQGRGKRGESVEALVLDTATGKVRWRRDDLPWLAKVTRTVYYRGFVAFEVSTLNDDGPGNAIHIVSATDGKIQLDYPFVPGNSHNKQARAMFVGDRLWLLHHVTGKKSVQVSAVDFRSGQVLATHPAGRTHCFPPVMTCRYMFSGEMSLTDLESGKVDAHQITKASCSLDGGWVPANGLIYVTPKHCVCWPMLRGYAALAPERPGGGVADMVLEQINFPLEKGVDPPNPTEQSSDSEAWPCYRHDSWRSGSTPAKAPSGLRTLWTVDLGDGRSSGPIGKDWRENYFVKGPITAPTVAAGRVLVARPDAHEVVALDAGSGSLAWRFTANGRVDTPPTVHQGLCLFGTRSGWVYCLRADDGRMVWKRRVAPLDEQIVAYGQLESPWPVPGSVLVVDDTAYFAAGRQSLADGGIFIFAVNPTSGETRWVRRLNSVPQTNFYDSSALDFDNFDLLCRQGDGVAMSRWVFDRKTGGMSVDRWATFAKLNTGSGAAMVPRGCWSYSPPHQRRTKEYTPHRPLVVFRNNVLFGSLKGTSTLYRREFNLAGGEKFNTKSMDGWTSRRWSREGKKPWRGHRLAEKASWRVDVFGEKADPPAIDAILLAGDRLFVAGSNGDLRLLSSADGKPIARLSLPAPLWDGMAVAQERLYYSTRDGQLLCLGE